MVVGLLLYSESMKHLGEQLLHLWLRFPSATPKQLDQLDLFRCQIAPDFVTKNVVAGVKVTPAFTVVQTVARKAGDPVHVMSRDFRVLQRTIAHSEVGCAGSFRRQDASIRDRTRIELRLQKTLHNSHPTNGRLP